MIFEYKKLEFLTTLGGQDEIRMLNREGADGWELVSVEINGNGLNHYFYFKRAVEHLGHG